MAQGLFKNPDLTPRELTVVETLVSHGGKNVELAKHLGISVDTVKTHLRHAYSKWGVHTRAGLCVEYQRRSLAGTLPSYPSVAEVEGAE